MANTYKNKVVYNGNTVIDLSEDTVTSASHILSGKVGHLANGQQVTGTAVSGWGVNDIEGGKPDGAIVSTNTSVRKHAWAGSSITSYTNNELECRYSACNVSIFEECRSLQSVSMSKLNNARGARLFYSCRALSSVYLPSVKTLGQYAFYNCVALTSINLPSLTTLASNYTFQGCTALALADFGNLTKVSNLTFYGCTALRTLILRKTSAITTLDAANANTLGGIYNNLSEAVIYVPSSLIDTYKTATNWKTLYSSNNSIFKAIENSIYE